MLEELIYRLGPSVFEMLSMSESAGDHDQKFDRHSASGDGGVSADCDPDIDMSDAKKRKENEFQGSRKKRPRSSSDRSP